MYNLFVSNNKNINIFDAKTIIYYKIFPLLLAKVVSSLTNCTLICPIRFHFGTVYSGFHVLVPYTVFC